jgi:hypothetical protein
MKEKTIVRAGEGGGIGAAAANRFSDKRRKAVVQSTAKIYEIEVKREWNYVSLSLTGALDISTARTCRDKLNEVLLAYKRNRVFVDIKRLSAKLSVIEDYELTKELRYALPSGVSIALVVPLQWTIDGEFIERIAIKNGVRLRSFSEKADALAWLKN